jgi:hypothetical protein
MLNISHPQSNQHEDPIPRQAVKRWWDPAWQRLRELDPHTLLSYMESRLSISPRGGHTSVRWYTFPHPGFTHEKLEHKSTQRLCKNVCSSSVHHIPNLEAPTSSTGGQWTEGRAPRRRSKLLVCAMLWVNLKITILSGKKKKQRRIQTLSDSKDYKTQMNLHQQSPK